VACGVLNNIARKIGHGTVGLNDGIDVFSAKQTAEPGVAIGFIGQQVWAGACGSGAEFGTLGAMHADADEIRESLTGIGEDFGCFRRTGTEDSRDVDSRVFQDGVGSGHGTKIAASACVRYPRSRGDLAELIDHFGRGIGGTRSRIKQGRGPIRERDSGTRGAGGSEVAEAIRDRLAHAVGVDASERG